MRLHLPDNEHRYHTARLHYELGARDTPPPPGHRRYAPLSKARAAKIDAAIRRLLGRR